MSDRFNWLGDIAPYLPPAFGALLGLRYAKNLTASERGISALFGFGVSVYFAPAIGEVLGHLPEKSPRIFVVISILTAMLGMDVLTGLMAIGNSFAVSPLSAVKDWWGAWKNK